MNINPTDANYFELIAALIGAALVTLGFSMGAKRKKMLVSGIRVEGVVFDIEREIVTIGRDNSPKSYPVIRFVTLEKEWVTKKYQYAVSSQSAIIGSYKPGDKVNVIYDPSNITDFILDDIFSKVADKACIIIGFLAVIGAAVHFYITN